MSAPAMTMNPPDIEGMVDLETLIKIHEQLVQSQFDEDNELAVFIREDFLPEDFNEDTRGGVPIAGKENFTKLYNAYKRVRNLTGRVQDKWPFFDRGNTTGPSGPSAKNSPASLSMRNNIEDVAAVPYTTLRQPTGRPHKGFSSKEATKPEPTRKLSVDKTLGEVSPSPSASISITSTPSTPSSPSSPAPQSTESENMAGNQSASSALGLALEGEPEHANLEELPKTIGKKRMNSADATADNRGTKRTRNSRRKRGRNHKSASLVDHEDLVDDVIDHTPLAFNNIASRPTPNADIADATVEKPRIVSPSSRVTRRQKHLSGDNQTQATGSRDSLSSLALQRTDTGKPHVVRDVTGSNEHNAAETTSEDAVVPHDDRALTTPGHTLSGSFPPPNTTLAQHDHGMANPKPAMKREEQDEMKGVNPQASGTVEIFARVNTGNSALEIALDEIPTKDENSLKSDLLGYATWKEKMGKKSNGVDFETWCSIQAFNR